MSPDQKRLERLRQFVNEKKSATELTNNVTETIPASRDPSLSILSQERSKELEKVLREPVSPSKPYVNSTEQREREFITSLLHNPEQLADVASIEPRHLSQQHYRVIYDAVRRMSDNLVVVTLTTLNRELQSSHLDRTLVICGRQGYDALQAIYAEGRTAAAKEYVPEILTEFEKRERKELLDELTLQIASPNCDPIELAQRLEAVANVLKDPNSGWKPPVQTNPFISGAISNKELNHLEINEVPIIEDMFFENELMVVAAASKSLKTKLWVYVAICIACGIDCLGKRVNRGRRVFIISAESGVRTLKRHMQIVCKTLGVNPDDVPITWFTGIEQLSTPEGQRNLEEAARHFESEVCITDPAYLLINGSVTTDNAANLFAMGGLLGEVNESCKRAGATLVIITHANSRVQIGEPMQLEHIAWSGFQQYMRQWWLISRRERYTHDGKHKLILSYGAGSGDGGLMHIDIDEGTKETGRRWEIEHTDGVAARKEKESEKESRFMKQLQEDCDDVIKAMEKIIVGRTTVASVSKLASKAAISKGRVEKAIKKLVGDGAVIEAIGTVEAGRGTVEAEGIRRPESWSK